MPGGETTSTSLADSMPVVVSSARQVREFPVGFMGTVDRETLPKGTGVAWREVVLNRLTAQAVGQTTPLDNPQEITDTIFQIEPEIVGVHTIMTRKVIDQISRNAYGQIGTLMQNAIQRKKEIDGFAIYDTATFSQPGAGNTLTDGPISALVTQMQGNSTEHVNESEPIHAWLHPYQVHDLKDDLKAGVGTYVLTAGMSEDAYTKGLKSIEMVGGARVHRGGNIPIDSATDAHGGVHAQSGIVLVEWDFPDDYTEVLKNRAGAEAAWLYDGYAYGGRSNGTLFGRIISDATAPTS